MMDFLDVTNVADNFATVEWKMGRYEDVFIDLAK
jgi:hypothetical protein